MSAYLDINESKLIISNMPEQPRKAIYRGWMMKPNQYTDFYYALRDKNIELITSPEEYESMHVFPNVYEMVKNDTAKMKIYPLHAELDVEELKKEFTRFMIKDYVKSVKGTEFPKFFTHDVKQEELNKWMDVFYKYRGSLLTGGICVKEYLDLKKYGERTNEYRVFYVNNEILTISRNSGQLQTSVTPSTELIEKYRSLPSRYYTVDFAELENGNWVVIEAGDGSVSGLSEDQDYEAYFRTLYRYFN